MSTKSDKPAGEAQPDAAVREMPEIFPSGASIAEARPAPSKSDARLRAIHDLVSSGEYHVPAPAIADRIIDRLLTEKRSYKR